LLRDGEAGVCHQCRRSVSMQRLNA